MKTVLVAEDNPTNRELLRELLEIRGYAVAEACNGEEALAMVEQTPPDILLDIGMPVLDGFAVVRTLRENPRRFAAGCGGYRLRHAGRSRPNHDFRVRWL